MTQAQEGGERLPGRRIRGAKALWHSSNGRAGVCNRPHLEGNGGGGRTGRGLEAVTQAGLHREARSLAASGRPGAEGWSWSPAAVQRALSLIPGSRQGAWAGLMPGWAARAPRDLPPRCDSLLPRRGEACPRHAAARVSQAATTAHGAQAGQGSGGAAVGQRQPVALAGTPAACCPHQARQHATLAECQPGQAPVPRCARAARARQAAARCCSGSRAPRRARRRLAGGQRQAEA